MVVEKITGIIFCFQKALEEVAASISLILLVSYFKKCKHCISKYDARYAKNYVVGRY